MEYFLAIDLGASSGRHVIGYKKNDKIFLNEIYRFKTGMDDTEDGKTWDLHRIFEEIITWQNVVGSIIIILGIALFAKADKEVEA
mgnify:CR=1 FL=1